MQKQTFKITLVDLRGAGGRGGRDAFRQRSYTDAGEYERDVDHFGKIAGSRIEEQTRATVVLHPAEEQGGTD